MINEQGGVMEQEAVKQAEAQTEAEVSGAEVYTGARGFFYDALVNWDEVDEILESFDESIRAKARQFFEHTLKVSVMDVTISNLNDLDKVIFLEKFHGGDETVLEWLRGKVENFDDLVKAEFANVKQKIRGFFESEEEVSEE